MIKLFRRKKKNAEEQSIADINYFNFSSVLFKQLNKGFADRPPMDSLREKLCSTQYTNIDNYLQKLEEASAMIIPMDELAEKMLYDEKSKLQKSIIKIKSQIKKSPDFKDIHRLKLKADILKAHLDFHSSRICKDNLQDYQRNQRCERLTIALSQVHYELSASYQKLNNKKNQKDESKFHKLANKIKSAARKFSEMANERKTKILYKEIGFLKAKLIEQSSLESMISIHKRIAEKYEMLSKIYAEQTSEDKLAKQTIIKKSKKSHAESAKTFQALLWKKQEKAISENRPLNMISSAEDLFSSLKYALGSDTISLFSVISAIDQYYDVCKRNEESLNKSLSQYLKNLSDEDIKSLKQLLNRSELEETVKVAMNIFHYSSQTELYQSELSEDQIHRAYTGAGMLLMFVNDAVTSEIHHRFPNVKDNIDYATLTHPYFGNYNDYERYAYIEEPSEDCNQAAIIKDLTPAALAIALKLPSNNAKAARI